MDSCSASELATLLTETVQFARSWGSLSCMERHGFDSQVMSWSAASGVATAVDGGSALAQSQDAQEEFFLRSIDKRCRVALLRDTDHAYPLQCRLCLPAAMSPLLI